MIVEMVERVIFPYFFKLLTFVGWVYNSDGGVGAGRRRGGGGAGSRDCYLKFRRCLLEDLMGDLGGGGVLWDLIGVGVPWDLIGVGGGRLERGKIRMTDPVIGTVAFISVL